MPDGPQKKERKGNKKKHGSVVETILMFGSLSCTRSPKLSTVSSNTFSPPGIAIARRLKESSFWVWGSGNKEVNLEVPCKNYMKAMLRD